MTTVKSTKAKAVRGRKKAAPKVKKVTVIKKEPLIVETKPPIFVKKYKCISCLDYVEETVIDDKVYFMCKNCGRKELKKG